VSRVREAVAAAIRERRKELKLTQQQVADRLGISQQVIARIESGASNMTVATLARIADALEADLGIEFVKP
jgi:transcriptional regulator with XRE-family HTH domain